MGKKQLWETIKSWIDPAIIPFALAVLLIGFIGLYRLFGLPSPTELSVIVSDLYQEYGLGILLIASFLDGQRTRPSSLEE